MLPLHRLLLVVAALGGLACGLGLPYWAQPHHLNLLVRPYGGARLLPNVSWTRLYFATEALGTYAMSPMLGFAGTHLLASWKLSPRDEDQAGQRVMWAASADGVTWVPGDRSDGRNVLFPSMNATENPNVALFAEPLLAVNGRYYAAASPVQFCLYPDQYFDVLLLRRVYTDGGALGQFGPLFWAAPTIPPGFAEASARENVTSVLAQDPTTQADVAALRAPFATPAALPCDRAHTSKCEACLQGCQDWAVALNVSSLENERSHFTVPGSTADVLLYRSHAHHLFAAVRAAPGAPWSIPAPTNISDDVANFNAGNLPAPDGRPYLVANTMLNVQRDPLFLSLASNGLGFDVTAAIGSCNDEAVFANKPRQPWGCLYRYQGGAKEGGLQYPQAMAVTAAGFEGFYVIVSQNKEDIWVARVPLDSIPPPQ